MRTKEQYLKSLTTKNRNLFLNGKKIDRDDDALMMAANVIGVTFDLAQDPNLQHLTTAKSHLTGETINRFCHVHQNTDDLHKKQDMTRMYCNKVSHCIGRCMGVDALNAINSVSF